MTAAIEIRDLRKEFANGRGVHGIDLSIDAGEVHGFLGPNGAGKSTTIRVLLGMTRPTGGSTRVLGLHPHTDRVSLLARIGYLPGELALHPRLTGRDHLDRVATARHLVDTTRREELVERFGARIDRPVRALSKGERQKIGIVLAFMHRPELLVLDEPTSGLDPLMQDEFARLVAEVAADGATVFLSSHELEEVQRLADRVTIIADGQVLVTDSVEGLRRRAPRTFSIRCDRTIDRRRFETLDGVTVTDLDATGHQIALVVHGDRIADLLRAALEFDPVDLRAEAADLESLFLAYYRHPSDAEVPHVA